MLVVHALANGPIHFDDVDREIGGVSQRMLILGNIEGDGLMTRAVFPTIPPPSALWQPEPYRPG